jgi:hypothetical protein
MSQLEHIRMNSSNSSSGSIAEVDMEDVDTSSVSIGQHHQQMQCHHTNNRLWGAVEIIPNRLYYSPLHFFPPNNDDDDDDSSLEELETTSSTTTTNRNIMNSTSPQRQDIHYFTMDDKLLYWNGGVGK